MCMNAQPLPPFLFPCHVLAGIRWLASAYYNNKRLSHRTHVAFFHDAVFLLLPGSLRAHIRPFPLPRGRGREQRVSFSRPNETVATHTTPTLPAALSPLGPTAYMGGSDLRQIFHAADKQHKGAASLTRWV